MDDLIYLSLNFWHAVDFEQVSHLLPLIAIDEVLSNVSDFLEGVHLLLLADRAIL